jgi:hypothetical protein
MHLDDPFPLDDVPPRVRRAILAEFMGRRPSIREVRTISNQRWLATPEIGECSLSTIRRITDPDRAPASSRSSSTMTDTELLRRLDFVQRELASLHRLLRSKLREAPAGKPNPRQRPVELMETLGSPHR